MPTSDFYNSSTNWSKENGFEIGDVQRMDINKKGEANREKYLLRTPVRDKNGNIVSYIIRRTGEAASNKTKKLLRILSSGSTLSYLIVLVYTRKLKSGMLR